MLITALILSLLAAVLLAKSGHHSSQLVESILIQRLVFGGAILAAAIGGLLVFEIVWPADPSVEGDLRAVNDELILEEPGNGVLYLECKMVDDTKKTGLAINVRLSLESRNGAESLKSSFQIGNSAEDMDNPKVERMGANIPLLSVGEDARVRLTQLGGDGSVYVHAAYRPARFPFYSTFIAFMVLVLLAIAYEGAAPLRSQRSFLSVTFLSVAAFIWFSEGGLTADDGVSTFWLRFSYSVAIGAVLGSLLPVMAGWILPEFKAPVGEDAELGEEDEDEDEQQTPMG